MLVLMGVHGFALSLSIRHTTLFPDRYLHIAMLYTVRLHVDYAALQCYIACLWLVNKHFVCLFKIAIPAVSGFHGNSIHAALHDLVIMVS